MRGGWAPQQAGTRLVAGEDGAHRGDSDEPRGEYLSVDGNWVGGGARQGPSHGRRNVWIPRVLRHRQRWRKTPKAGDGTGHEKWSFLCGLSGVRLFRCPCPGLNNSAPARRLACARRGLFLSHILFPFFLFYDLRFRRCHHGKRPFHLIKVKKSRKTIN